jgi:predicted Zn-dependent peptidase
MALHDTGLFLVRAGVDNQKIVEAVDVIYKELQKIIRYGVSQNEFQRAREYLSGQLQLGLEDTMEHMLWIGEGLISKDEVKTPKSVLRELAQIKMSDIQRVAKEVLGKKRLNLAVVGPLTGNAFEDAIGCVN